MQLKTIPLFQTRKLASDENCARLLINIHPESFNNDEERRHQADTLCFVVAEELPESIEEREGFAPYIRVLAPALGVLGRQLAYNRSVFMAAILTIRTNPEPLFTVQVIAGAKGEQPIDEVTFYNLRDDLAFEAHDMLAPAYRQDVYFERGSDMPFMREGGYRRTDKPSCCTIDIEGQKLLASMHRLNSDPRHHIHNEGLRFYSALSNSLAGVLPPLGKDSPFETVKSHRVQFVMVGDLNSLEPETCQLVYYGDVTGYMVGLNDVAWDPKTSSGNGEVIADIPYRALLGGERAALADAANRAIRCATPGETSKKIIRNVLKVVQHKDGFFTTQDISKDNAQLVLRQRFMSALLTACISDTAGRLAEDVYVEEMFQKVHEDALNFKEVQL